MNFSLNTNLTFSKIKSIELSKNMDIYYNINKKKDYIKQILLNKINDTDIDLKRLNGLINKKQIKFQKSNLLKNIINRRNFSFKKSKSYDKINIFKPLNSFYNTQNINLLENLIIKRNKSEINIKEKRNEIIKYNNFTLSKKNTFNILPLDLKIKKDLTIYSNQNRTTRTPSLIDIHSSRNKEIKATKKSQSSINIIIKNLKIKLKEYEKENKSKNKILNNLISERLYSMNKKIKFKYNIENDLNVLNIKIKKTKKNKNIFEKIMTQDYVKRNKRIKSIKENLSKKLNKWSDNVALDYIENYSKVFKLKKNINV